jgi:hypothetical protein
MSSKQKNQARLSMMPQRYAPNTPTTPGANAFTNAILNQRMENEADAESVLSDTVNSANAVQRDIFDDSSLKYKGKPVKGYKFLLLNVILIIALVTICSIDIYKDHQA